ncbi:MAG TPA: OsmC family protein [Methylocella sp.]|nr:OsmC family protein [Methylocella sp.]
MADFAHLYKLMVTWTGNLGPGTASYTAYGRDHLVRAPGKPDLALSADPAFRGNPGLYNPEELLLAALASCHMLSFLHLCANGRIIVGAYEDNPCGRLIIPRGGKGHFEWVELRPKVAIKAGNADEALQLHHGAHETCFIANSVNFPVRVTPEIVVNL